MYTGGVRCRVQRWRRQGRRSHGAVRAQLLACSSGRLRQTPVYVRLKGGKDRFHRIAGRHIFLRSTIPPHILVCDLRSGLVVPASDHGRQISTWGALQSVCRNAVRMSELWRNRGDNPPVKITHAYLQHSTWRPQGVRTQPT